ncbi:disulfide bond formation protein B [Gammaproteobacteria bacterium]|jgi:disulfide bond formation protein DsbB|nr:disulfide bond formation protein B [Gammaproteobacteria bacterium]|tara:strand:- start:72 stop:584 length:513 start_codon:yes stop_codon:yes gene_type:complete
MALAIPNNKIINIGVFLATVTTIGIALYLEHVMLFSPCGLCITQRVFFILCGLVCLASAIHNPTADGQKIYAFAAAAMCIFGSYFAGRQIWLQHLPEDLVPACGPGFTYIRDNFPFMQLLDFLLVGDGNCAEVQFRFLGIFSIAEMSIIAFAGLFTVCLYTAFRQQAETH